MTPQHETRGLVAAMQCRDANNKEMERQVKKYGRDQLAPPLHAHDGLDKTAVDNEVFTRALVLKGKGDRAQNSKKKKNQRTDYGNICSKVKQNLCYKKRTMEIPTILEK